jgi:hypothetical protein
MACPVHSTKRAAEAVSYASAVSFPLECREAPPLLAPANSPAANHS